MSPRVIGYTYCADAHCIDCTRGAYMRGELLPPCFDPSPDENDIPTFARDREGNPLHPIFSTDEVSDVDGLFCGDCFERIA